ncbi:hypothetical protein HYFRA_00009642 [Hymenoscyphus fraxineus]|uniref:Uncharacterized protein n=1 Tax=Hymenoscyphus fraxineus TaxID=746836 RepID=A0A9N9PSI0_9HELO|nr:hypothetical protein HYFRA_00009642 [Hymenoscyphus fraxineus]
MSSSSLSVPDPNLDTVSPKRKRSPANPPTPPLSSSPRFRVSTPTKIDEPEESSDSRGGSPRTKVSNQFQSLQIADGAVSKLNLEGKESNQFGSKFHIADDDEMGMRKRSKTEIPETPDMRTTKATTQSNLEIHPFILSDGLTPQLVIPDSEAKERRTEMDPVIFKSGSPLGKLKGAGLKRAYPSINRLSDSKSRSRKSGRAGTPPLQGSKADNLDPEELPTIVDPERAALTWHDDEITGHDPSDPEDDGEGINGIGFKPTVQEAHVRAQKRKAQMAEYKTREAKEARARRNERRRGSERTEREEAKERARRVRFLEAEKNGVVLFS